MKLEKYSIGIGDRFGHQGIAQLRAVIKAQQSGLNITPVWNKSNREHIYVQSHPEEVRKEADAAVKFLGFKGDYFVDADHVNLNTVEPFIASSDFFTLDVASYIGKSTSNENINAFINSCKNFNKELSIPGIEEKFEISNEWLENIAKKFLLASEQAAVLYQFIKEKKKNNPFIVEVSMDEVPTPQTPLELFFILKMLADKKIPLQTIAPKFTGRFNKGIDYQGDIKQFAKEFEEDILVIDYAIKMFNLPQDLKLSIHSGSDKFSIYPFIAEITKKHNKGFHLKTAGTTWLEEIIGLAAAGNEGLILAKKIYAIAFQRKNELCEPYSDVIDIDENKLPRPEEVETWTSEKFVNTLRHVPDHPDYNPNFRQLIHVAYKIAAEMKNEYFNLLEKYSKIIETCVEENIFDRHLKRLFDL